jgi:glucosamine 6-phosphate synthetase-like amidotransferase/phosphosugar isomerase protein
VVIQVLAVRYGQTLSNLQEVSDHVIFILRLPEMLLPILEVMPPPSLAYHIALRRGQVSDSRVTGNGRA